MTAIGRHLYVEQTGDQGGNGLYRWTPALPSGPSSGGSSPAPSSSTAAPAGTTAGIVIGILVALANTTLLVLLAIKVGGAGGWGGVGGGGGIKRRMGTAALLDSCHPVPPPLSQAGALPFGLCSARKAEPAGFYGQAASSQPIDVGSAYTPPEAI